MAKDTFNLNEWVGKGEKNLLNEETEPLNVIYKLKAEGENISNNPEAKAFFDNVFSDAGIDITSKDSFKRMLNAAITRSLDKELVNAFEKNTNKVVQEDSNKKPTFLDAMFDDNWWGLRFFGSAFAGIGNIIKIIFKLVTGDYVGLMEDIMYALGFILFALFTGFGEIDNPDPTGKGGLRVVHRRKKNKK